MKPIADPLYAYVEFHARFNPQGHAVRYSGGVINYAQFRSHIDSVTARLAAAQLPKASVVGLQLGHPYLHWLLIFAAQRLGLVSAALDDGGADLRLLNPHAVITDSPQKFGGVKTVAVSPEWITTASDPTPGGPYVDCTHDEPTRIVMSSGTTGTPKKALFTFAQLEARAHATVRVYQLTSATELLTTVGITTVGGLVLPICAWVAGGTVVMPAMKAGDTTAKLLDARPNTMFMSTAQLGALMRTLPSEYIPPQTIRIFVAGSPLPLPLIRSTRLRLTHELINVYGSTEVGTVSISNVAISESRPSLTGFVVPQCEVEIVDDNGKPLPKGTPGDVRIRVAGQCSGYIDDPKTNAECFRDGWFHPGDLGVLGDDGSLSIQGRTRELMNFNGVKVAPHVMEEALGNVPGMKEFAVFSYAGDRGLQRPCAAVVADESFSAEALQERFKSAYPLLSAIAVVHVASIPRNDMGKVMRAELAKSLAGQLPKS